jgi:hypothetical protein
MMNTKDLETSLRLEIKAELQKVTKANSPLVWAKIHSPDGKLNINGYTRIESRLIDKIIAGQLIPSAAIPQLEQELDFL